ncbi:alpha/beta fold hydrolase [Novosphingobium colocasiae]|uniref:3-oxoadipate enol-lactonase n=1 Tax=Novosphingobium colocasiae TaxID=1256513 RepID=A0A918UF23_9SPHN|nr:alpha/beta hydrolase [Novosphingobium colocasiae]GGY98310.1 3-oxoadipate enol-lactonase [Novosphingobium colocasiae]
MPVRLIASPGGAQLAVDDTGPADGNADGPVLVFSHGFMMNRQMFAPQVDHFRARYRCVAWDARGHGDTRWDGPFDYWDSARDLLAICDALDLARVVHVGMSQGGLVGMRAALLRPGRLAGLVQLATQAGAMPEGLDDSFARMIGDWIDHGPDADKLEFLASFILGPGVDHATWHQHWRNMTQAQVRDATGALMTIDPLWHRLGEVTLPVATIHGLADIATSHELGLRTPAAVPDPRGVTLIEGGPHAVNLTHPAQVNRAIEEFLQEIAVDSGATGGR